MEEFREMYDWNPLFADRAEAGRELGKLVTKSATWERPLVLALPRGGVSVAKGVGAALGVPIDVVISRKVGAPGHPEFGIGALSEDGRVYFNPEASGYFSPESPEVQRTVIQETQEMQRRIQLYRHGKRLGMLEGRDVIVVDDGLATGSTAVAAGNYLSTLKPKSLTLAIPVAPLNISRSIKESYDEVICLHRIRNLSSVGMWYRNFNQVSDAEVIQELKNV